MSARLSTALSRRLLLAAVGSALPWSAMARLAAPPDANANANFNGASAAPPAASRAALVIGNGAYNEAPLRNPVSDAKAVAAALERLGFATTLVTNGGWQSLGQAVRSFGDQHSAASMRVVYYAGHGAQIRGRNYMVPVDVDVSDEADLIRKSIDANELVQRLARQPQAVNLLILDACRNNPASQVALAADGRRLRTRSSGAPGLARMQAPAGSLIAYATAPGQVADDRAGGEHSLYTKHLLAHIATPGMPLERLFKRVRLEVLRESQSQQQPWEENSLTVEACLSGRCSG
jgi:uncharacterized caspase-like protein